MSYIGKTPTPAPLTSSDITDGIITTTKIADANVTNPKLTSGSQQNFRNIIINGDMSIAQRGTSASSLTGNGYNTCDRWYSQISSTGTWTQSQSTDVPTGQGFATSYKWDCTTADASPAAGDSIIFQQRVEAQNLQYLKKGTANAESTTLSFWVKSNKTGTYITNLYDENNRDISKAYTISSANTWEKKTLTFAGDTSGAFGNDNAVGLYVNFYLAAGSNSSSGTLGTTWSSYTAANTAVGQVNLADSTSNEWYVTGVQLEAGTTASDFEFLPVDVNLERCQRYYYVHAAGASKNIGMIAYDRNTYIQSVVFFPTSMRTAPSMINTSGTNYYRIYVNNTSDFFDSFNVGIQQPTTTSTGMDCNANISGTAGHAGRCLTNNASSLLAFSSEL